MARIRTVKPEVAKHELLFELEQELGVNVRFAWVLLPGHCDREGRFKWRPNALKTDILPYDRDCDFSRVLDAWVTRGLLVRYRVKGEWYGWIPTFRKHQAVNPRESASELPGIEEAEEAIDYRNQYLCDASGTRQAGVGDASGTRANQELHFLGREGKGREGNTHDASGTRETVDVGRPGTPEEPPPHDPDPSLIPTRAAAVCVAMRAEGLMTANPSHAVLLELLKAGAEIGEFVQAAKEAVAKHKRFDYALAIVRNRRAEAAELAKRPAGNGASPEPRWEPPDDTPEDIARENAARRAYGIPELPEAAK